MSTRDQKERIDEMINRVYADLPASIRNQMIASEFASIDAKAALAKQSKQTK